MIIPESGVQQTSVRYFFTPSALAEELYYYPTRIGHYFCDHFYHFDQNAETARLPSHCMNLMLFAVTGGALQLKLNGHEYIAGSGQIVLFDCREPHEYSASDDTEFYWLLFNGANARAIYDRILLSNMGKHSFPASAFPDIVNLLDCIVMSCVDGERMPESVYAQQLFRLLCMLLPGSDGGEERTDACVGAAIRFIRRNLHRSLTVEDVAREVGLSSAHFSRRFKRSTGYAPYEFIILRRIDEAKYLLASTSDSVKEIAFAVGYESEEHFNHAFRRKVGVPPGLFRKYPI